MDWLWLFLGIAGLVLLWLLIIGMDKLTQRLKAHDEARKISTQNIAERTAEAEAEFLRKQYEKDRAKAFIENTDFKAGDPYQKVDLEQALGTLSSEEFVQSVAKRIFGAAEGTNGITAAQSALDQMPTKKAVASGDGITPVKVKSAGNYTMSKAEQKLLKKIKQGD